MVKIIINRIAISIACNNVKTRLNSITNKLYSTCHHLLSTLAINHLTCNLRISYALSPLLCASIINERATWYFWAARSSSRNTKARLGYEV